MGMFTGKNGITPVEGVTPPGANDQRLFTALVTLDGRISNPADIPFNAELLTDESALTETITRAIEANPRLSRNFVSGDVGQGPRGNSVNEPDLISLMRAIQ